MGNNTDPYSRLTEEGKRVAKENEGLPIPAHINDRINELLNSGKSQEEQNIEIIPLMDEADKYFRQVGWLL